MCSWFTGTWTYDWGGLISREGGRGLISSMVWYGMVTLFIHGISFRYIHIQV